MSLVWSPWVLNGFLNFVLSLFFKQAIIILLLITYSFLGEKGFFSLPKVQISTVSDFFFVVSKTALFLTKNLVGTYLNQT